MKKKILFVLVSIPIIFLVSYFFLVMYLKRGQTVPPRFTIGYEKVGISQQILGNISIPPGRYKEYMDAVLYTIDSKEIFVSTKDIKNYIGKRVKIIGDISKCFGGYKLPDEFMNSLWLTRIDSIEITN